MAIFVCSPEERVSTMLFLPTTPPETSNLETGNTMNSQLAPVKSSYSNELIQSPRWSKAVGLDLVRAL